MAAPKKSVQDLKTAQIIVYLPDGFKDWVEKQARINHVSSSAYMLRLALEDAKKINNKA